MVAGVSGVPKKAPETLELELQVFVNLGTEPGFSGRAANALNHWAVFLAPSHLFLTVLFKPGHTLELTGGGGGGWQGATQTSLLEILIQYARHGTMVFPKGLLCHPGLGPAASSRYYLQAPFLSTGEWTQDLHARQILYLSVTSPCSLVDFLLHSLRRYKQCLKYLISLGSFKELFSMIH